MLFTHPQFNPVALSLGPLQIHWYGLMYLLAFIMAWALGRYRISKGLGDITQKRFEDLLFYGILGVVLGGRLGYVLFYQPSYYFGNPLHIFSVWDGGMSFHGGLLGVLLVFFLFAHKEKKSFSQVSDFSAPLVPLGLAAGRWGNFMNGELWGRPTGGDWGVIFPVVDNIPRHPSQLYEMCLEGFALFIILWLFSSKRRPIGQVSALFLICYGIFRFLIEYTREPDSFLGLLTFNLSMGQWLSIPMVLFGVFIFIISAKRAKTPA